MKSDKNRKTGKAISTVESRITRNAGKVRTEPVQRKSKEDAAEELAGLVLKASDTVSANIEKSGKGKCVVVEFTGTKHVARVTCLVFHGASITVLAEQTEQAVFNMSKHGFDDVDQAAKFVRCAFVKDKQGLALKVRFKKAANQ